MTQYRRGANYERKIKKEYEEDGYLVLRSAGSKGPFDLVAIKEDSTILIQCKLRKPTKKEIEGVLETVRKYNIHGQAHLRWPEGGLYY